jgi:hypothetical protein
MRRLGTLLLLAAMLAGCSDSAAPAAQGNGSSHGLDPCRMASRADLKTVLGGEPLGPQPDIGVSVKQCSWFETTGARYAVVELLDPVTTDSTPPDGYGWTREDFDSSWDEDASPVDGLGDSAWYAVDDDSGTLYILKGQLGYAVGLDYMDAKNRPDKEQILAALKPFAVAVGAKAPSLNAKG